MNWDFNRVSTSKQIFAEINKIAEQPLGIIVFGVNCRCKHRIMRLCADRINKCIACQSTRGAKVVLKNGFNAAIDAPEQESDTSEKRGDIVSKLRAFGAKTVIGICVCGNHGDAGYKIVCEETARKTDSTEDHKNLDYLIIINAKITYTPQ